MDYFKTKDFQEYRKKVCDLLEGLPSAESPTGWIRKGSFSVGGFEYFGFTESSDLLVVISSQGRSIIDMSTNEKVARDHSTEFPLDEVLLTSEGFDILEGKTIKLAGKYGGSILPTINRAGESLVRASPLYPCEDILFQPPFENCFNQRFNKNCVRIYRGFLYCYGFSFSGKYFVASDDGGITYWEAMPQA
jgi:hypothetical protein